ncbi:protein PIP-1-like [Orycteropus afer afer]|uniref:Protein PIP-1-like n=1 Tax=Orycteropus afer afer TaxID=1230840 RepID=A0AC54ZAA9_ORYAF|nr:protein PIP-1-like [Orycteropus afer afer]
MGKHLLLLLLGLSLLLGFLQALQCYKCNIVNPDGSCKTMRTHCQTENKQQCLLKMVTKDNVLLYANQDCGYIRSPSVVYRGNLRHEMKSCNDKDFCNKM